MATCLIGLGSNLGEREQNLVRAIDLLRANPDVLITRVSSHRTTRPAGGPAGQGEFLNAAAILETALDPPALLAALQSVESELGRVRGERWDERVVDLDLLLYDRLELKTPLLELPHPRMSFRRFVLEAAAEIAPELVYPINGWTIAELLANLDRPEKYIAIGGVEYLPEGYRLLQRLSAMRPCRLLRTLDWEHPFATWLELPDKSSIPWEPWINRHAELIAQATWPSDDVWTLSDFWFEELPTTIGEEEKEYHLQLVKRLGSQIVRPVLVVLIEKELERRSKSMSKFLRARGSSEVGAQLAEFRRTYVQEAEFLNSLVHSRSTGPVLRLSAANPEQCVAEVLAAMQAME